MSLTLWTVERKSGFIGAATPTRLGLMLGARNVKEPWSRFTALHLSNGSRMLNLRSFVLHAGTRQKRSAEDSAINDSRLTLC